MIKRMIGGLTVLISIAWFMVSIIMCGINSILCAVEHNAYDDGLILCLIGGVIFGGSVTTVALIDMFIKTRWHESDIDEGVI